MLKPGAFSREPYPWSCIPSYCITISDNRLTWLNLQIQHILLYKFPDFNKNTLEYLFAFYNNNYYYCLSSKMERKRYQIFVMWGTQRTSIFTFFCSMLYALLFLPKTISPLPPRLNNELHEDLITFRYKGRHLNESKQCFSRIMFTRNLDVRIVQLLQWFGLWVCHVYFRVWLVSR